MPVFTGEEGGAAADKDAGKAAKAAKKEKANAKKWSINNYFND